VAVRLVARDRLGRTTTVRRTLTVSPIALDIKSLNAAPTVTAKARLLKVRVAVTTPAVLRAGGRSYSVTTRAQTVSVGLPSKPATGLLRVPLKFTARGPKQPVVTTTLLVNRG
jgi:hypothetical protein